MCFNCLSSYCAHTQLSIKAGESMLSIRAPVQSSPPVRGTLAMLNTGHREASASWPQQSVRPLLAVNLRCKSLCIVTHSQLSTFHNLKAAITIHQFMEGGQLLCMVHGVRALVFLTQSSLSPHENVLELCTLTTKSILPSCVCFMFCFIYNEKPK